MKKILILAILTAISFSAAFALNEPYVISFQGKLEGVTSPVNITFKLFPALTGGTQKWSETISAVPLDSNGIFNVLLGEITPLGNVMFDNPSGLWMEVTVGAETLSPRQALTAAPYAFVAKKVYGDTSGNIVYAKSSNDNAVFAESSGQYNEAALKTIGKGSARAIIANAEGRAIQATSGNNFAITGYKEDDADNDSLAAIYGQNNETNTGENPGVKGESVAGIGVAGKGKTAGGSFESTSGYGVFGSGEVAGVYGYKPEKAANNNPAVLGKNDRTTRGDNPGVRGESVKGFGVYGSGEAAGVYGKGANAGGSFEATAGTGVRGKGTTDGGSFDATSGIGVRGKGTTAGGSFEATGGTGVRGKGTNYGGRFESTGTAGVYGESTGAFSRGVYGKGLAYGGQFESVGGYGVHAKSESEIFSAIYATNASAGGIALEIPSGKIKVAASKITTSSSSITMNKAAGTVTLTSRRSIRINNNYVTQDSIILTTIVGRTNMTGAISALVEEIGNGYFDIHVSNSGGQPSYTEPYFTVKVNFLIIN